MSFKKHLIAGACLVSSLSNAAIAAGKNETETSKKSKDNRISKVKSKKECSNDNSCYNARRFQIGPYLNKDRMFDGSELVINQPSVREDAGLLLQQYQLMQDCAKLGIPMPAFPRLTISGQLEGQLLYNAPYNASNYTRFTIDNAELDLYFQATSWLSSYVAIDYDPTKTTSKVFMNRAFVTLGNLSVTPFYASVGKMYVPFGHYASSMVTEPETRDLGRTLANAVVLGYQQTGDNALHGEVYLYQGVTRYLNDKKKDHLEYGADAGYTYTISKVSGDFGAGVISNLADSVGVHSLFNGPNLFLSHRVPALDVYGSIGYDKIKLLAEYITALRHFAANDFAYNNHGARPSAFNTELAYAITSFNRPSSVAIGYSQTSQAVALGLPQRSYRAVYNINIVRNTNLAIEYRHDINYSVKSAAGTGADTSQLGKSADAVTAQFDYYF